MVTSKQNSWRTLAASLSIAGVALTLLLLAVGLDDPGADGPTPARAEGALAPGGDVVGVRVAAPGVTFGGRRPGAREGGEDQAADVVATATAEVLRARVRGRVVNANTREPIFGVPLGVRGAASHEILGWSASEGQFELETEPGDHLVETHGSSWATVVAAPVAGGEATVERELVLVAAPAMDLSGFVVRADGAGVAGAEVRLEMPAELVAELPGGADPVGLREYATSASQRGYFELLGVPAVSGAVVTVTGEGFEPKSFALPGLSSYDLTWVVDDPVELIATPVLEGGPAVRGTVVRADGEPAGDARVRLGEQETTCDWQGEFTLPIEDPVEGAPLFAWLPDLQPAFRPGFGSELALRAPDERVSVELTLGGPTVALRGRVVGEDGAPCSSWVVGLLVADGLAGELDPPLLLEELVGGGTLPEARTDADGAFELTGLLSRNYHVRVWDPETLVVVHAGPFPAGSGEEIVVEVPADGLVDHVAGRVESVSGRPLAGARVRLRLERARTSAGCVHRDGASAIADERGAFTLARVPRRHVELVVSGETIDEHVVPLAELDPAGAGDLVLRVAERAQLRVESDDESARSVQLLDAGGEPGPLAVARGDALVVAPDAALVDGTTEVLTATEGPWTLVLHAADGSELERRAVELAAGQVLLVRHAAAPAGGEPPPAEVPRTPADRAEDAVDAAEPGPASDAGGASSDSASAASDAAGSPAAPHAPATPPAGDSPGR